MHIILVILSLSPYVSEKRFGASSDEINNIAKITPCNEQRGNSTTNVYTSSQNPSREFTIHYTSSGLCSDDLDEDRMEPIWYHRAHFKTKPPTSGGSGIGQITPHGLLTDHGYTPTHLNEFLKMMEKLEVFWDKYGDSILKEDFCKEIECDPVPPDVFRNHQRLSEIGSKFALDGNNEAASAIFKHALKIAPNDVYVNIAWANALSVDGKHTEAKKYYDHARKISPNNPYVLASLGASFVEKRDFVNAETQFKKILKTQPDHPLGHNILVNLSLEKAKSFETNTRSEKGILEYQKALEHNTTVLNIDPENKYAKDIKSIIESQMRDEMAKPLSDSQTSGIVSPVIPTWIKNNAGWWADGLIEERDFVNGIEYLVKNGVIQVN